MNTLRANHEDKEYLSKTPNERYHNKLNNTNEDSVDGGD